MRGWRIEGGGAGWRVDSGRCSVEVKGVLRSVVGGGWRVLRRWRVDGGKWKVEEEG